MVCLAADTASLATSFLFGKLTGVATLVGFGEKRCRKNLPLWDTDRLMSRPISKICTDIDAFTPIDDEWLPLDDLIAEALDHSDASAAYSHLLNVFSRFPDDDGAGVFWSIIHGLETFPDYQPTLLAAIRAQPTDLTLTMVNRMLNGGETHVGDTPWLSVLQSIAENDAYSQTVRATASRFVELHSA